MVVQHSQILWNIYIFRIQLLKNWHILKSVIVIIIELILFNQQVNSNILYFQIKHYHIIVIEKKNVRVKNNIIFYRIKMQIVLKY
jgi:hypothetical protein